MSQMRGKSLRYYHGIPNAGNGKCISMLLSGHLVIHYHTFVIRIYALDIAIRNQFPIR
jgi:hypothetical protein